MIRKLLMLGVWISFICFYSACNGDNSNPSNNSDLIIKAGYICGWGSGTDTLEISKTKISYVYYVPNKSDNPKIIKSRLITESEWNTILNCINTDDFIKLNYNECNYCRDGCDDWINIKNNQLYHQITYRKDMSIDTIKQLQIKLAELRKEFNN